MREKKILVTVIEIQKEIGGNHAFFRYSFDSLFFFLLPQSLRKEELDST